MNCMLVNINFNYEKSFNCRELERQMQKRQATQKYISEFKASREAWKIEEKKKMEEENAKILAFARKMQEREAYLMSQKKEKDQAMDKVQEQVGILVLRCSSGQSLVCFHEFLFNLFFYFILRSSLAFVSK